MRACLLASHRLSILIVLLDAFGGFYRFEVVLYAPRKMRAAD